MTGQRPCSRFGGLSKKNPSHFKQSASAHADKKGNTFRSQASTGWIAVGGPRHLNAGWGSSEKPQSLHARCSVGGTVRPEAARGGPTQRVFQPSRPRWPRSVLRSPCMPCDPSHPSITHHFIIHGASGLLGLHIASPCCPAGHCTDRAARVRGCVSPGRAAQSHSERVMKRACEDGARRVARNPKRCVLLDGSFSSFLRSANLI